MKDFCAICGEYLDEDNLGGYVEIPTKDNIQQVEYFSTDKIYQHKPVCDYEFEKSDGSIFIFDENLVQEPIEFLFKDGIVLKNSGPDVNFLHRKFFMPTDKNELFEKIRNACKIAEAPKNETVDNKMQMIKIKLSKKDQLTEFFAFLKNEWKQETYVLAYSNEDDNIDFKEKIQVYVDKKDANKFLKASGQTLKYLKLL